MWIRVEGKGGGQPIWIRIFLGILGFFKGSFDIFNAYLVVFGLFLTKTEKKLKILIVNHF